MIGYDIPLWLWSMKHVKWFLLWERCLHTVFLINNFPTSRFLDIAQVINIHKAGTQWYKQDILPKLIFYNQVLFHKLEQEFFHYYLLP